ISWTTTRPPRGGTCGSARYAARRNPSPAVISVIGPLDGHSSLAGRTLSHRRAAHRLHRGAWDNASAPFVQRDPGNETQQQEDRGSDQRAAGRNRRGPASGSLAQDAETGPAGDRIPVLR